MKPALVIDSIGGSCPCQAEGSFYGFPFYFRARHGTWTIEVAEPGEDPVCNGTMYQAEGDDPDGGYMSLEKCAAILVENWIKFFNANADRCLLS